MYLLDANVFIQAKNFDYGFAFCPAFWDWLDDAFARNVVFSVEKVDAELTLQRQLVGELAKRSGRPVRATPNPRQTFAGTPPN